MTAITSINSAQPLQIPSVKLETPDNFRTIKRVAFAAIAAMVSFVFYTTGTPFAVSLLAGLFVATVSSMCLQRSGPVYTYIGRPNVIMREEPSSDSMVASEVIYGERVTVLKSNCNWAYISASDGYKGWVPRWALTSLSEPYLPEDDMSAGVRVSNVRGGYIYAKKDTEYGPHIDVPYRTKLRVLDDSDVRWVKIQLLDGKEYYIQKGDITPEKPIYCEKDLLEFVKKFIGLHYAFGGKSWEFDCSAFTQMIYAALGIRIPRDSKDQIKDEQFVEVNFTREKPQVGDLVFWGASPDKIRHVGMCIGENQFIHAAVTDNKPWIRIDNLDHPDWNGKNALRPYRAFRRFDGSLFFTRQQFVDEV